MNKKDYYNTANLITYIRIILIPVLMLFMVLQNDNNPLNENKILSFLAALVYTVAAISDLIDGYYARKYGQVSLMGKFIDPIADKLIMMAALVMMIPMHRIPAWLVVLLLFREIVISGMRSVAAGEGIIIDAGIWGKRKTAFLNVGIIGLLLYYPWFGLNIFGVGWIIMIMGCSLSLFSGALYLVRFFRRV